MTINPMKYGIKEVADVTFYDITTGDAVLFFDTLKISNLEFTADTVYARGGKGNPKLIAWDSNREIMLNMQDALVSQDMMALMAGASVSTAATVVEANVAGTVIAGEEAAKVFTVTGVLGASGIVRGAELLTATTGVITDVSASTVITDDTITVTTAMVAGDTVTVWHTIPTAATAETITFNASTFPGTYKIVGDTLIRDTDGVDHAYQFVVYKGKLQPGFNMTMEAEGDPSVFDMNVDVLANSVGNMIELIKY